MRSVSFADATTPVHIIPVIDLLHGQVVRAVAGNRDAYRPIESRLTPSSDPLAVIDAMLDLAPFPIFYIADLDAITDHGSDHNRSVLMQICTRLFARGGTDLWLDAGNAPWAGELADAAAGAGMHISLVAGSESLGDGGLGAGATVEAECVLSLDYRAGHFLGPAGLANDATTWPNRLIVMDLAAVGVAGGPAFERIDALMARAQESGRSDIAFYAAGGVRDEADLDALAERQMCGVLVASALHDGRLCAATLPRFLA